MIEETGIDYTLFNTDKSLMRCTTDRIPNTYEASKSSGIPFGIIVKPYGDLPPVSMDRYFCINDLLKCRARMANSQKCRK